MSRTDLKILEAVNSRGEGLRIEFSRNEQRWTHRLVAVEHGTSVPLLESVEGCEGEAFPPSPALQQLAFQQHDDGRSVALLVGMAGRNHWSVAIEAFPENGRLCFDVACRCQQDKAGFLGSRYKTLVPWGTTQKRTLVAFTAEFQYDLVPAIRGAESNIDVVGPVDGQITLRAVTEPSIVTLRWCYELQQTLSPRP